MFWPFAWGLTLAAYATHTPLVVYTHGLGKSLVAAFLLRSSACTVNDIFDRDMDAGVARTKGRPLPSGRISVHAACWYLLIQYILGFSFFYFTTSGLAFVVALFQLFPLFAIYPLLKRVTYWPQAWLGFAMNFGLVTAWMWLVPAIDFPLIAAGMAGCWCWTMLYDTIYACQDIKDDVTVGVRSTAILFGDWIRTLLVACGVVLVLMLTLVGVLNHQGIAYFVVSVGGAALHLVWQYATVDLDDPKSCWRTYPFLAVQNSVRTNAHSGNFNQHSYLGLLVWLGLVIDYGLSIAVDPLSVQVFI
ncbi:4-hydroxybenzoate polyprenyltransferase, mitochondrial [Mycena indigotica]|uniref:4-hydroxybenzoate polyprenyltransferase, mitochondrial n=1 Tax=Mycena indigotica TaxID=2126181 RepID=A0A8H6SP69_9AGAR|nr:4-hydroxybenzoate polyprenyltransferase, mitochondrial [Mycena indigotica]KAF7303455.1 4-hydroxybenzoate polyprenyltransferase, mitochondrial [Mycena indigotica]